MAIGEIALLGARLLPAGVFLLAGATKLADPRGFRRTLVDFGLPRVVAGPFVALLPAVELAVAGALVSTSFAWYGASGALGLFAVFSLAIGMARLRGKKPDCHCFGRLHSRPVGRGTLLRNSLPAACAGWVVWNGRGHPGPDLLAWYLSLSGEALKVTTVAACLVGFGFLILVSKARPRPVVVEEVEEEAPPPPPRPVRRRPPPVVDLPVRGIGLPIGTPAPDFELPALGGGTRTLRSFLEGGKDVVLLFTSPYCESCVALMPKLGEWPELVLVSTGKPEQNAAKMGGFDASRVLLQREFEVSESFECTSTPTAVRVGADGGVKSDPAMGAVAIKQLLGGVS